MAGGLSPRDRSRGRMRETLVGIDIGGTHIKAVVTDAEGAALQQLRLATGDADDAYKIAVADLLRTFIDQFGEPSSVGISSPGLAARDHRSIAWMRGRMAGLEGYDWSEHLDRPVRVLNDAHAALLGETWRGAAAGSRDAVMLTLGTGVGGAILCDGRLLRGHLGRAGHLGHISLNPHGARDIVNTPGSLEDLIGDHTVVARSGGRFADTKALVTAVHGGDGDAKALWAESINALAAALVSIINSVDPEVVILGGGIAKAGAALLHPLQQQLDLFEWRPTGQPVRLVFAILDEFAGAFGAARFAMTYSTLEQR
jgi:glucokinase